MVRFDPALRLPSALELPDSDNTPVDNELQIPVAAVLRAILASLWKNREDWFLGINMGLCLKPEQPGTAIVPDGFLSFGVPRFRPERYGEQGRPSYVLWKENHILPLFVLEVVSKTYNGEYDSKLEEYRKLGIRYCAVYDPAGHHRDAHAALEVYELVSGTYVRLSGEPVWLAGVGLGLGRSRGTVDGWPREWLYWFSDSGERHLVPEEFQRYRADRAEEVAQGERQARRQAEQQAEVERQARLQAEQQAEAERQARAQERIRAEQAERQIQQLRERLRALGINPDTIPPSP